MSYMKYRSCIEACNYCMAMCNQCADACLEEKEVYNLKNCIRLDLECAVLCRSAVEIMTLDGNAAEALCQLCADACTRCAEECEKHAEMGMEHCRICAEACRRCADECVEMTTLGTESAF